MNASKVIFGILLASFIGIMSNPEVMVASNSVELTQVDETRVVETLISPALKEEFVLIEVVEPEITVAAQAQMPAEQSWTPAASATPAEPASVPDVAVAPNQIQILGNAVRLVWTDNMQENAGAAQQAWYYISGKFIYGHDYGYVFGTMNTAYDNGTLIGTPLSVTMDGATRVYTVTEAEVYTVTGVSWKMANLAKGGGHSLVLMTCYGDKRLVVYAD